MTTSPECPSGPGLPAGADGVVVVALTPPLARAVDDVVRGTRATRVGPAGDVVRAAAMAASFGGAGVRTRPVFVATRPDLAVVEAVMPLVARLRSELAIGPVAVTLHDPDYDIDVVWGHVFASGLLAPASATLGGEPALVEGLAAAIGGGVSLAPLRLVRDGPRALAAALASDAATGHSCTLVDGADPTDVVTMARATAGWPLTVGSLSLLREVLRHDGAAP